MSNFNNFNLKIITPDGVFYDGKAYELCLMTVDGELAVLAGHIPYLTAVGMGECRVYEAPDAPPRRAACCGGMLTVSKEQVVLAPVTFEWAEDIDLQRAELALKKAEKKIQSAETDDDKRLAQMKLKRAQVRIKAASNAK